MLIVHLRLTIFGMDSLIFLKTKLNVFQKSLELSNDNNPLFVSQISGLKNEHIDFISATSSSKVRKKSLYFMF